MDARGMEQFEIAQELGVSQQQVSYDLRTLRERFVKSTSEEDRANRIGGELHRLEQVYREAMHAWERSKLDEEVKHSGIEKGRTDKKGKALPDKQTAWTTRKGQSGNPALLEKGLQARRQIAELLGLVVKRHAIGIGDIDRLIDAELARIAGRSEDQDFGPAEEDQEPGPDGGPGEAPARPDAADELGGHGPGPVAGQADPLAGETHPDPL